jgi:holo-ACP synthase
LINKILEDREKRYNTIIKILKGGAKSVVCGKINFPGQNKNTQESLKAFGYLSDVLKNGMLLNEKYEILEGFDGKSIIAGIDAGSRELKKKAVEIEESSPIGRVFDIDIYDSQGVPVGRRDIGAPDRTCIVCGGNAKICVREQAHSLTETLKIINKIINDFEGKNGEF